MRVVESELVAGDVEVMITRSELPELPPELEGVTLWFTEHGRWNAVYRCDNIDPTQLAGVLPDHVLIKAIGVASPSLQQFLEDRRRDQVALQAREK